MRLFFIALFSFLFFFVSPVQAYNNQYSITPAKTLPVDITFTANCSTGYYPYRFGFCDGADCYALQFINGVNTQISSSSRGNLQGVGQYLKCDATSNSYTMSVSSNKITANGVTWNADVVIHNPTAFWSYGSAPTDRVTTYAMTETGMAHNVKSALDNGVASFSATGINQLKTVIPVAIVGLISVALMFFTIHKFRGIVKI